MADFLKYAESVLKILAILAAGAWAIYTFIRKREWYPKAKLSHKFTVVDLDDGQRVLRVDLAIENTGEKLLRIKSVLARLQQVNPPPVVKIGTFEPSQTSSEQPEIGWPTLHERNLGFSHGECEVEPGESHSLQFDYLILSQLRIVQAYSYVENRAKWLPPRQRDGFRPKEIGWSATDIFHVPNLPKIAEKEADTHTHRTFDQHLRPPSKPDFSVIPDSV